MRAKGAGFYQFSGDEEERRRQMEELKLAREETERTRREAGAVDMRPSDVEGMRADGDGGGGVLKSRAMEKRKRELEERRRIVDAKRRKIKGDNVERDSTSRDSLTSAAAAGVEEAKAEASVLSSSAPALASLDPFAALEAQRSAQVGMKGTKGKEKVRNDPQLAADDFLAQLERDLLSGQARQMYVCRLRDPHVIDIDQFTI